MKTTETMAKPTTVTPTTVKPTTVTPTTVKPTTVKPTMVMPTTVKPTTVKPTMVMPTTVKPTTVMPTTVTPTTVTPSTVTPTTMAVKNPKMVIDAFTDAQIRTRDPVVKASLEKAKSEMPKTYRELEILMEVLDSISNHMSVGHNSKEKLESMMTVLEVQFNNYEISWENSMWEISDDVFYEFEELYLTIAEAVDKVKAALFESKKFLREKSIQRGKDRNNGRDRNNSGYRNRDAKNVQKHPRSSKKTKEAVDQAKAAFEAKAKAIAMAETATTAETATMAETAMETQRTFKNVQDRPRRPRVSKSIQERPRKSKNVLQGLRRWYLRCTRNWRCCRRSWIPSIDTGVSALLPFQRQL